MLEVRAFLALRQLPTLAERGGEVRRLPPDPPGHLWRGFCQAYLPVQQHAAEVCAPIPVAFGVGRSCYHRVSLQTTALDAGFLTAPFSPTGGLPWLTGDLRSRRVRGRETRAQRLFAWLALFL